MIFQYAFRTNCPSYYVQVLVSTLVAKCSVMERDLSRMRGSAPPTQANPGIAAPVPSLADTVGISAACGRRLKEVFKQDLFANPLLVIIGHFSRRSMETYSHTPAEKLTHYVRRIEGQYPDIFGGVTVDFIFAQSTTDFVVTKYNKWQNNTRSKMNEMIRTQWKSAPDGTSKLCIREGETAGVAMTERILELSTIVSTRCPMYLHTTLPSYHPCFVYGRCSRCGTP